MENWRKYQQLEDEFYLLENKKVTWDTLMMQFEMRQLDPVKYMEIFEYSINERIDEAIRIYDDVETILLENEEAEAAAAEEGEEAPSKAGMLKRLVQKAAKAGKFLKDKIKRFLNKATKTIKSGILRGLQACWNALTTQEKGAVLKVGMGALRVVKGLLKLQQKIFRFLGAYLPFIAAGAVIYMAVMGIADGATMPPAMPAECLQEGILAENSGCSEIASGFIVDPGLIDYLDAVMDVLGSYQEALMDANPDATGETQLMQVTDVVYGGEEVMSNASLDTVLSADHEVDKAQAAINRAANMIETAKTMIESSSDGSGQALLDADGNGIISVEDVKSLTDQLSDAGSTVFDQALQETDVLKELDPEAYQQAVADGKELKVAASEIDVSNIIDKVSVSSGEEAQSGEAVRSAQTLQNVGLRDADGNLVGKAGAETQKFSDSTRAAIRQQSLGDQGRAAVDALRRSRGVNESKIIMENWKKFIS